MGIANTEEEGLENTNCESFPRVQYVATVEKAHVFIPLKLGVCYKT